MKIYGHLPGYLHRWRIIGFGRYMMRLHRILDTDATPFLHTHPFSYVSIILRGGYTERVLLANGQLKTVKHRIGSIIIRRATTPHRIDAVEQGCMTLFLTRRVKSRGQSWSLIRHNDIAVPTTYHDLPDGVYEFNDGFRVRRNGMWFTKAKSPEGATRSSHLSIHQNLNPNACRLISD